MMSSIAGALRGGLRETGVPADIVDRDNITPTRRVNWATAIAIFVGAGILHFGSKIFLPLAIAMLIAFALSPMASAMRRKGLPNVLAVLIAVTVAFLVVGGLLGVMGAQIGVVIENLPTFQSNIIGKLDALQADDGPPGVLGKFVEMMSRINDEVSSAFGAGPVVATDGAAIGAPVTVAVVENQSVWKMLQDVIFPIISPVVTVGLIIVVVIFMLLEREELRDRFIRLTGANDLHRTTEMLEDAGSRVATYLLIQILVNVVYAVPIGLGLWFIGVPNPVLWALLTLVMRFVPYIGPIIAAAIPLFLAFAASPDWSLVLWTAALFIVVELITSNIIEPKLYGARTGLSPLAVIIAAIIWTWIWGPMGLILSTPLTVCLVVLGRYLPQFQVFDILFGDEPVLAAHAQLYQRLLTGETVDSVSRAEEALEDDFVAEYYQSVGIPALLLAQTDYDRGVLTQAQEERIARSARRFVASLEPVVAEERADSETGVVAGHPDTEAFRVMVAGGRSNLDDVAAQMLGQALAAEGAEVTALPRAEVNSMALISAEGPPPKCLILTFLDPNPARASLLIVRRIKRAVPQMRVGVVIWQMPDNLRDVAGLPRGMRQRSSVALRELETIGADFVATAIEEAMVMAFADASAKPLPDAEKRAPRKSVRLRGEPAAA